MRYASELTTCYAPTVNSYKRFQSGSWAPTALAWSRDNRTAAFRVVGEGPGLRIECRIPGADVNPYLAYAAVVASGLAGIEQRIEPPAAFDGDVYTSEAGPRLPGSLEEATDRFEASEFAREAFGDDVVQHLTHFWRTEADAYSRAVTDWERVRYFERG
jgi:glutamine synthetase